MSDGNLMGAMTKDEVNINRINLTARDAYWHEGPGIGGNKDVKAFLKELVGVTYDPSHRVIDIGFGEGYSLLHAFEAGVKHAVGIDLAQASIRNLYDLLQLSPPLEDASGFVKEYPDGRKVETHWLDISYQKLPFEDNSFDIAICTEAIEHMTNPYHMVSEVKRVLAHDGLFLLSFPAPARTMGYGGGQHAQTYPGFLDEANFRIFMRQLYFRAPVWKQNGGSDWCAFRNYKGDNMLDFFHIMAGNYDEKVIYGMLD